MKQAFHAPSETLQYSRVSKVIQVHPSLQCNLACKHCYSGSAPGYRSALEVRSLLNIMEELAEVGYNVISLSGGEPFLYRSLEELLTNTRRLGYFNSVTTNAMLLSTDRAKRILKQANLIAVSIDGKSEQHDYIRNFEGAFDKMKSGVEIVKDNVPNFGFIHTAFADSWKLLPWLVDFAITNDAGLLHLHPLELAGRASESFNTTGFDSESLHKLYIVFHYLKNLYAPDLFMQLDLLHRDNIIENPNFIFHQTNRPDFTVADFSNIFKELIINEKGDIIPISHGCSDYFKIGNIYQNISCGEMIENFMEHKMNDLIHLYDETYQSILADEENELFNWSEIVIQKSHELFNQVLA
jgi:Fe-coproporphyrin III synthase